MQEKKRYVVGRPKPQTKSRWRVNVEHMDQDVRVVVSNSRIKNPILVLGDYNRAMVLAMKICNSLNEKAGK